MPVAGVITQYMSAWHSGVDIAAPYGTTLVAVSDGIVSATGWVPVGGLRVCVMSGAVENCYYHTGAVFVAQGQWVERGEAIASIGMTGVTTGPHVHWETKVNGALVNPLSR
jgi:murein DD-endopeptidase MepM/ murein hydrolase activator NlpD